MALWRVALTLEGDGTTASQDLDVPWPRSRQLAAGSSCSGAPNRPIRVGCAAGSDLVVPLGGVSPQHLEFRFGPAADTDVRGGEPGVFLVRDVSRHGAALCAKGMRHVPLQHGADTPVPNGAAICLPWRVEDALSDRSRAYVRVNFSHEFVDLRPQTCFAGNDLVGFSSPWRGQASPLPIGEMVIPTFSDPMLKARDAGVKQGTSAIFTDNMHSQVSEVRAALHPELLEGQPVQEALGQLRSKRCGGARRLEALLNTVWAQLVFSFVSLAFILGTALTRPETVTQEIVETMAVLGTAVVMLSIFEFGVAVSAQVGSFRIWHFFWPLFHKILTIALCLQLFCIFEVTSRRLSDLDALVDHSESRRITITSVVSYRLLRALGIYLQVSVKATLLARRQRLYDKVHGVWADEHARHQRERRGRVAVRLQRILDTAAAQAGIIVLVLVYCVLYSMTVSWVWLRDHVGQFHNFYWVTRPVGYALLAFFTAELVLRCWAQQGEGFFVPCVHKFEVFVLFLGMFTLGYSSLYIDAIKDSTSAVRPQASVTAALLLLHRILRLIELRLQVAASRGDASSVLGASVAEWLRVSCGDVIAVPRGNIKMSYDNGVVLEIRKAMVKPEALQDLHLPVTFAGVYLEELFVHLPHLSTLFNSLRDARRGSTGSRNMHSVLRLRGATILLEPGPGLYEAGVSAGVLEGWRAVGQRYWAYERLLEAQARTVQLFVGQFPWALPDAAEKVQAVVDQCIMQLELDIKRVRVHFSDPQGILSPQPGCVVLKVGSLWAHWLNGTHAAWDITRLSLDVEPGCVLKSSVDYDLKAMPPRRLAERFYREDMRECLRCWGFGAGAVGGQRTCRRSHSHAERWGLGPVFSVHRIRLRARACMMLSGEHIHDEEVVGDDFMNAAGDQMFWHVQTQPVNLVLDEMQAMYLKRLLLSTEAWKAHDHAFRWRPAVSVCDVNCCLRERKVVARLWWLYAVKRVVATLPWVARKTTWMEGAWITASRKHYAGLLRRSWLYGPRSAWESRWLRELQLQIGLAEALRCRAAAFVKQGCPPPKLPKNGEVAKSPGIGRNELAGHWHVYVPCIGMRLVRRRQRELGAPRDLLLSLALQEAALDVQVPSWHASAPLAASLSLDDITGFYFPPSTIGLQHTICQVRRPLDYAAARPRVPLLQGTRSNRPLACLARLAKRPDDTGLGEFHLAELDLTLFEPCAVSLLRDFVFGGDSGSVASRHCCGISPESESSSTMFGSRLYQQQRRSAKNAWRVLGLFAQVTEAVDEEDAAAAPATLHFRTGLLRKRDMLQAASQAETELYELLSCASGALPGWDLEVHIGALKCTQVGDYSPSTVLLEEIFIGPFQVSGGKQVGHEPVQLAQAWLEPDASRKSRRMGNTQSGYGSSGTTWLPASALWHQQRRSRRVSTAVRLGARADDELQDGKLIQDASEHLSVKSAFGTLLCSTACMQQAKQPLRCIGMPASFCPANVGGQSRSQQSRDTPQEWSSLLATADERASTRPCQATVSARVLPRSVLLSFGQAEDLTFSPRCPAL